MSVRPTRGPFIFYEVGGAGGIWGVTPKKPALKGGPSKKNMGKGGSHKILPLLEGGPGKNLVTWGGGGSCNFLMTLQKIPPAPPTS